MMRFSRRCEGAGEWLLETSQFKSWVNEKVFSTHVKQILLSSIEIKIRGNIGLIRKSNHHLQNATGY